MARPRDATIRPLTVEDAAALLELRRQLFSETNLMLLETDEINLVTVPQQSERLRAICGTKNSQFFGAEADGQLVGFLLADGGPYRRNAHVACLVVGILETYHGRGIGTALFHELHRWAPEAGLSRLELTVMVHNENALRLYQKLGYEIEGKRVHGTRIGNTFIDEFYMAKLLHL